MRHRKAEQLSRLPREQREMIDKAIDRMKEDPFQGDVQRFEAGKWEGHYSKLVGRYRLIFISFSQERRVEISSILPLTEPRPRETLEPYRRPRRD